jgi:transposase
MKQFETRFKQLDVLPMVKYFIDELKLLSLFNKYVPATPDSLVDHAQSLCILTANIICANQPLYKVQEWLSNYSDGIVDEVPEANLFNDDRLARALSALFRADRHSLMTQVSSNAISVHRLLTDEIHNDSTSITFIGNYKHPDADAVKLTHGHNKDFRPDCKQIVFGLNITSDGHVPLSYKLFDGNTNDDLICKEVKQFIDVKILTERKQIKVKILPGRPSLKSVYKTKWQFKHSIQWALNQQALLQASKTDGIFPLITNTRLEPAEVLKIYKNQPFLENRLYTKKTVLQVAPVFLKKEKRIEAILFLYFVALMIVSLIKRKIRMNMANAKIEKLPILPQAMNTKKPTWNNIRYFFRNVHYSQIMHDGICIQSEVKGLSDLHKQINRLLDVPSAVYKNLQPNWWQFKYT